MNNYIVKYSTRLSIVGENLESGEIITIYTDWRSNNYEYSNLEKNTVFKFVNGKIYI